MKTTFIILLCCLAGGNSALAQIVTDGDFETTRVPVGEGVYTPTNALWSMVGGAGIISPPGFIPWAGPTGASFQSPAAPSGSQICFVQSRGSYIAESINLPATGSYRISYQVAGRPLWPTGGSGDTAYGIFLDTNTVSQGSTTTGQPFTQREDTFIATKGIHTLKVENISPTTGDNTAFFDAIQIVFTGQPQLSMTRSNASVILSCPISLTSYSLQQNPDLGPLNWSDYAGTISDNGVIRTAIINVSGNSMFYRLKP